MGTREVRAIETTLELRAAPEGSDSPGTVVGYAAVFNRLSLDLGGFRETIKPGAFSRALKDPTTDVLANRNHRDDVLLGRSTSGTLRMQEDPVGLRVEFDLPDNTDGRDTAVSLARRDYRGMSFAFICQIEEWDWTAQLPLRSLIDCDLFDVSVVGRPAYPDTSVALRSLDAARASLTASPAAAATVPAPALLGSAALPPPPPPTPARAVAPLAPAPPAAPPSPPDLSALFNRLKLLQLQA